MKKTICILLISSLLLTATSCVTRREKPQETEDLLEIETYGEPQFELSLEIKNRLIIPGEMVNLSTNLKYISGAPFTYYGSYSDFRAEAHAYPELEDGTLGKPVDLMSAWTEDEPAEHEVKAGDGGGAWYGFMTDENHIGSYTVKLTYGEHEVTYPNAFEVVPQARQNTTEKYEKSYSGVTVKCGDAEINPISCTVWCNIYDNGMQSIGDGIGAWRIFDDKNTNLDELPILIFRESISATAPEGTKLGEITVFSTEYKELYRYVTFGQLNNLPAGDYLIVYGESVIEGVKDSNYYAEYANDGLFRLIVREK